MALKLLWTISFSLVIFFTLFFQKAWATEQSPMLLGTSPVDDEHILQLGVLLGCFSIDFVLLDIKNMVIMDAANIFLVIHKEARFKVIINANLIGKSLTI